MVKKAIVIEDDVNANDLLAELLEINGIKVVGQGFNGKDAIELFTKYNPDYTLLDMMMPDHSGFFAIEAIQKIEKDALIFVVTADTTPEIKKSLENLAVSGIIYKPYEIDELIEILNSS